MSVPAARIRTSSGWRDIAIQGAQGPPGPMRELAAVTFGNITAVAAPGALMADFGSMAFDGEPVTVEFSAGFLNLLTNSNCSVHLHDFITGSDVLVTRMAFWRNAITVLDGSGVWCPISHKVRITPSAGNHRYRLRFQLDSGPAGVLNQLELPNQARIVKAAVGGGLPLGAPLYVTPAQFATLVPTNGMEVYLVADAANGVIWHLRYNAASASAYKWEFVGGSPLIVSASNSLNSGGGVAPFATPVLTYPRAGDYKVGGSVFASFAPNVAVSIQWAALIVDGANSAAYGIEWQANFNLYTTANQSYANRLVIPEMIKTGLAAGATAKILPSVSGYDYNALHREIRATPIRIS